MKQKNKAIARLMAYFGLGHLYLGQYLKQVLFLITGGGCLMWWAWKLIKIGSEVDNHNQNYLINNLKDAE